MTTQTHTNRRITDSVEVVTSEENPLNSPCFVPDAVVEQHPRYLGLRQMFLHLQGANNELHAEIQRLQAALALKGQP